MLLKAKRWKKSQDFNTYGFSKTNKSLKIIFSWETWTVLLGKSQKQISRQVLVCLLFIVSKIFWPMADD